MSSDPMSPPDSDERQPLLDGAVVTTTTVQPRQFPSQTVDPSEDGDVTNNAADDQKSRKTSVAIRLAAAMLCFANMGLNLSSIGVLLQYWKDYYHLSDTLVSLTFLAIPAGYLIAAQSNGLVHTWSGLRGIAIAGPAFLVLAAVGGSLHPPFAAFLVASAVAGLGTGLIDAAFCAFAASLPSPNVASGLLHGAFSTGAALGPLLAGLLITAQGGRWYLWYFVLLAVSGVELAFAAFAFRYDDAASYREQIDSDAGRHKQPHQRSIFSHPATWVCAAFMLLCVGTEAVISDWIVVFMMRIRHAPLREASLCSTGYWAGQALGRLSLGIVTEKIGVKLAVVTYFLGAGIFVALFAIVKTASVSAVMISFVGVFCGPGFPSSVVLLLRLLPGESHVRAVSFVASIGQVGSAVLPFALGAMAQTVGIQSLPYVVLICLGTLLLCWIGFSQLQPRKSTEETEDQDSLVAND